MAHTLTAFAAHNWGTKGDNHRRVRKVVDLLQARGVRIWFDEKDMRGNILSAMCRGIDAADVVVVFVTRAYIDKVENGEDTDNARREFMYAARTPGKLLAVRFDSDLPKTWSGPVGMVLGSQLYCNMAGDATNDKIEELIRMMSAKAVATNNPVVHKQDHVSMMIEGTACMPVKKRVQRLVDMYGSLDATTKLHTKDIVDHLFVSIVGGNPQKGLLEKLHLLEVELKVAAA